MRNVKSDISHRLLAAILAVMIFFNIVPLNTAVAEVGAKSVLATDIGSVDFMVNTPAVFTVGSTANDDAGKLVKGHFVFSDPTAIAKLEYYETAEGMQGWYELNGEFGPSTGFPIIDGTSTFRATFNNAGTYTVKIYLKDVETSQVYCSTEETVTVKDESVAQGEINVRGINSVYMGEAQEAVIVSNKGDYSLKYQLDDGDGKVDENAWTDSIPTVTDAGKYLVWVKAVKDGYNDLFEEVILSPCNVYISKADIKDIAIAGKELAYNEKEQELVLLTGEFNVGDKVVWTITENTGLLSAITEKAFEVDGKNEDLLPKAKGIGTYTVKLTVDRGANYNLLTTEEVTTVISKDAIDIEGLSITALNGVYTVENGLPVAQEVVKVENKGNYDLKYQLDDGDGNIDENAWGDDIPKVSDSGSYLVWVKAVKAGYKDTVIETPYEAVIAPVDITDVSITAAEGLVYNGEELELVILNGSFAEGDSITWYVDDVDTESDVIPKAQNVGDYKVKLVIERANYNKFETEVTVNISLGEVPDQPYTLSGDKNQNGWYKSLTVTAKDGYRIAKETSEDFTEAVTFEDEGKSERYIYLKKIENGEMTDKIPVVDDKGNNIGIDHTAPVDMSIEYSDPVRIDGGFNYYNQDVTVTFKAKDTISGIAYIDWTYTGSDEAKETGRIEVSSGEDGFATATVTLSANEAKQYCGKVSFTATDLAGNTSEECKNDDYTFVADNKAPILNVNYQKPDASIGTKLYYKGSVDVTLRINEVNFDSKDVEVSISKNSGSSVSIKENVSWTNDNATAVGTFTLSPDDGDYVVYVTYTDKSSNKMSDYQSETITIDTTKPVITVIHDNNPSVQKTTITVKEHNFRPEDVSMEIVAKDINGNKVDAKDISSALAKSENWKLVDTDKYVFETKDEYYYYADGVYTVSVNCKDISGNNADEVVVDFIVDRKAPTAVTVEFSEQNKASELGVYKFYNPSVIVKFTAYDETSGIKEFTWDYKKENGASVVNHPEIYPYSLSESTVKAVQDETDKSKFTAQIELTKEEAEQFRGYISVYATDAYKNIGEKKTANSIVVVDTVKPVVTVDYTVADRIVNNECYYNNAVDVKLTVTEANFYQEDVKVTVTKNGQAFDFGQVTWGAKDADDKTIGYFTLPAPDNHLGDGHYVITVEYTDRSGNVMDKYESVTHTIDTSIPVIDVKYDDEAVKVVNTLVDKDGNTRMYYSAAKTATITVMEHNFVAEEVAIEIAAKDITGKELDKSTLVGMSEWVSDATGDIHTITITYPGDANYTFDVNYADKATNETVDYEPDYFTVDKTTPANLKVEYSTSIFEEVLESLTFGFYNAKMTVTITAEDDISEVDSFLYSYLNAPGVSSVNKELIDEAIKNAEIKYSEDRRTATAVFEIPKMILGNDNQFNGTVEFTATDRAGNVSDMHEETKRIVVDNIAPTAQVTYNKPINSEGGISYYDGNITATITINEANFYEEDVKVKAGSKVIKPVWVHESVDVHVGTFTLTEDGEYVVSINYTDKSSNKMNTYTSKPMVIDTQIKAPTYTINGVRKSGVGGAYKGKATVGFNFEDPNFDSKSIKLTRTRFDKVEDVTNMFIDIAGNKHGGSGTFSIPTEVGNDGVYVLKISMSDKTNHRTESQIKFTINRFGSVYEYNDELSSLIKDGGQYVTSVDQDLVITEYNADKLLANSLKIIVTRDGEALDVDYSTNPSNINSQVNVGKSGWYQYIYTIKASNFEKDGEYKISLISKYAATDSKENESTSVPENSVDEKGNKITDSMEFTVDSVAPEIRNIVNLDQKIADVEKIEDGKLNVKYTVVDVGGLGKVEVIVNDKPVQTFTEESMDDIYNFSGSFDIAEQDGTKAQKVRFRITDLAGNVTDTDSVDFLDAHSSDNKDSTYVFFNEVTVSSNALVRWFANTPVFWGSMAGSAGLIGGIGYLISSKKKKKEENQ